MSFQKRESRRRKMAEKFCYQMVRGTGFDNLQEQP